MPSVKRCYCARVHASSVRLALLEYSFEGPLVQLERDVDVEVALLREVGGLLEERDTCAVGNLKEGTADREFEQRSPYHRQVFF
jgi:hypothetical protein